MTTPLSVGILGTAAIAQTALIAPALLGGDASVVAVASRSLARAEAYSRRHAIPRSHGSYQDLLDNPEIDAVYIPLPSAMHEEWILAAIESGKHVLCEKPFTANAASARHVAAQAVGSLQVMEAYHSHYHPLQERLAYLVHSGAIGTVRSASASFSAPIPPGKDIRWNLGLGGGGLLDVGYYPVRQLRDLFGSLPVVASARAKHREGIDRSLSAELVFAGGVTGTVHSSMWSPRLFGSSLRIEGEEGFISVNSPFLPHRRSRVTVRRGSELYVERVVDASTYRLQLNAFIAAVRGHRDVETTAAAAVDQLTTIDAIYEAAGLSPRPSG